MDAVTLTPPSPAGSGPDGLVTFYDGATPIAGAVECIAEAQLNGNVVGCGGSPHSITAVL